MRLGLFGVWTQARGAGIVNQRLWQALTELGHEVCVLGRPAEVAGRRLLDTTGAWGVPHLRTTPAYQVNPNMLLSWAQYEKLEAVIMGEEYDFSLPLMLQRHGIRTIQWVDAYLAKPWRLLLKAYSQLWCLTHRAESILLDWGKGEQTQYIGFGVPLPLIRHVQTPPRYDFMHSAGWIGLDARKGTDTLIAAMALMRDEAPELLLHCQMPEAMAKQVLGIESWPPHVVYEDADVPLPGLYALGRVVVQPSKIEGIGLSLPEALCAGRPVITTDAPPMTEFVSDAEGWLADVDGWQPHVDGSVYQQAIVRPETLAKRMQEALSLRELTWTTMCRAARGRALSQFDWDAFKARIGEGLERLA